MTIKHVDHLGQLIEVGDSVAICKNLWRGRDEIQVAKVAKLTKARVTFTNGSWSVPAKVLVLNASTLVRAAKQEADEAEERRLDDDNT